MNVVPGAGWWTHSKACVVSNEVKAWVAQTWNNRISLLLFEQVGIGNFVRDIFHFFSEGRHSIPTTMERISPREAIQRDRKAFSVVLRSALMRICCPVVMKQLPDCGCRRCWSTASCDCALAAAPAPFVAQRADWPCSLWLSWRDLHEKKLQMFGDGANLQIQWELPEKPDPLRLTA